MMNRNSPQGTSPTVSSAYVWLKEFHDDPRIAVQWWDAKKMPQDQRFLIDVDLGQDAFQELAAFSELRP